MGQFLKRISIFVAVVLLFFVLWRGVLYKAMATYGNRVTHSATVFVGDSRMNYLYQSADNYGITAESIVYSYYKLKYILSQRKLDTVVLAVGYNSISSYYNNFINNVDIIERYYLYLPDSMQRKYLTKMKHPRIMYERTMDWMSNGAMVVGCYNDPPPNRYFSIEGCNNRLKEQYDGNVLCDANLKFLDSIRVLCAEKGAQLILLNPPAHPYYEERVPAPFRAAYNSAVTGYTVWNLAHEMRDDSLFLPDGDHITARGAAIMTRKIDSMRALAHR